MWKYDYTKFDWSVPICKDHLSFSVYNNKFKLADAYLNGDVSVELARQLLQDRTIRAYLLFKVNNDRVRLFPYQDLITGDDHRFVIFRAANQIGKSFLLDVQAADNLIMDHGKGHNEAILSGSLKQATYQMLRTKDLLNNANVFDWKEEKGSIDSMSMISFDIKDDDGRVKYTNRLIVAPGGEGILGFDLDVVNLDEFEFWKDIDTKWFLNQLAEPRTYHTKGKIRIYSNPNGADAYVAELERLRLPDGRMKYHTYVFNFLDKPGNTQDDLDFASLGKTRAEVESTLLAVRTVSDQNYFTPDEIDGSFDPGVNELRMVGKQPFFFLDVGAKHDQSVLVGGYVEPDEVNDRLSHIYVPIIQPYPGGYPLTRVVGVPIPDGDGWEYVKSVKEWLGEYGVDGINPVFGVDVTGNTGISPLFESVGIYPEDVTFSGPVKSGMYQRLKYFMEKRLLHRCKSEEFDKQFGSLEVKKSQRGYLMIHHRNEDDLDDVPDAIAGLVHLADGPAVGNTLKII